MNIRRFNILLITVLIAGGCLFTPRLQAQAQQPGVKGIDLLIKMRNVKPSDRPFSWYQQLMTVRYGLTNTTPGVTKQPPQFQARPWLNYNTARQWLISRYPMLAKTSSGNNPQNKGLLPSQRPYSWYKALAEKKLRQAAQPHN